MSDKIKTMKQRKLAVFDIDGTIFRSSLLIELTGALIQEGLFPATAARRYKKEHRRWMDRKGSYEAYINAVVAAFDFNIKGVPMRQFMKVARRVASNHKNMVYRFTRDLVADLKKRGYFLLAISHSPRIVVNDFATSLGFDRVYARLLEADKRGRFTGKVLHEDVIYDKALVLRRFLEKEGLTLRGSVGVGDTESDIRFLQLVSKPICFNPNAKLYAAARRRGWQVVVERKDVVYRNI